MVEFINELTGSRMFVDDSRVEEYKAKGHTLADSLIPATAVEIPEKKKSTKRAKVEE